jgi:hypothetical protein
MKGTISTSQKCHVCGGVLKYIEAAGIMQCQSHPQVIWRGRCFVRFGAKHTKRFQTVRKAQRHLTYIRVQTDKKIFDQREWAKDQPLSFLALRLKFIKAKKRQDISSKQVRHIERVLELAGKDWDRLQVKYIIEGEIDDFFTKYARNPKKDANKEYSVGNKTLHNWKTVLHDFWKWVVRREKRRTKVEMPDFPEISFKLGWRSIIDMETQASILDEAWKITKDVNPRIWLGIKLLSIFPKVRPGEMRNIQEGHINLKERWIFFPDPKEGDRGKFIHLADEDCQLINSFWEPKGLPHMFFFRHLQTRSGVKAGVQFGPKYFKKWWDKACKNLGIEGIDLYGGTRHSTVTALGKFLTPEQIQRGGTGHVSDAFKRYMLPDVSEAVVVRKSIAKAQPQNAKISHLDSAKKSRS